MGPLSIGLAMGLVLLAVVATIIGWRSAHRAAMFGPTMERLGLPPTVHTSAHPDAAPLARVVGRGTEVWE